MTTSREQFEAAKRQNAAFFFPESAVWSDGVTRRFKVSDPTRLGPASALEQHTDPLRASLRLVRVHPDDPMLPPGSSVVSAHGLVVLGSRTDVGNLSGATTYTGRLIDARLRAGLGALPACLSEFGAAELAAIYAAFGQEFTVVSPPARGVWNQPTTAGGLTDTVRGLLLPASRPRQQTAVGAGLPVPAFVALLPVGVADLGVPGWHLQHNGQRYYPTADTQNEGGRDVVWIVELGAPGEVTARGDLEPDWTDPPPP